MDSKKRGHMNRLQGTLSSSLLSDDEAWRRFLSLCFLWCFSFLTLSFFAPSPPASPAACYATRAPNERAARRRCRQVSTTGGAAYSEEARHASQSRSGMKYSPEALKLPRLEHILSLHSGTLVSCKRKCAGVPYHGLG